YYTGVDDCLLCFYCDGGLFEWKSGDNPWVEHAKWYPNCNFLKLKQTKSFIDTCDLNMLSLNTHNFTSNTYTVNNVESNEQLLCKICYANCIECTILPCGHQFSCIDCCLCINDCSICRQKIKAIVKIYIS
ncbi:MAG: RING-HC finger protein, partial [Candidatus Dormibacteria bacterium]